MTTFDERGKSFEEKYRRDQELQFKVNARRNKLLGLWAAKKLGLEAGEAESYAKQVVAADFEMPGDEDVVGKVFKDLTEKGISSSEKEIRREMDRLLPLAKEQIEKEIK